MARRRDPNEFLEMFGALRRCLQAVAAQAYAVVDMGTTQAKFLRHIGRNTRISQAELARATGTDPTLTGRILQTLIERGLVRRERSETDRREYVLELEPAGRRVKERVEKLRDELAERIISALDEQDIDDFDRITKKILAELDFPAEPT